ncbi:MAG: response regulator [Candidatus Omnitrophota bacterium]
MKNLLIVEDDIQALDPLSRFLEERGYAVRTAHTVKEALAYCKNTQPNILLADLHLPDGTALELLQKVRETTRETIFVLMTEMGDVNMVLEALRLGADDYLFKPLTNLENVVSVIEKEIKKHPGTGRTLSDSDIEQLDRIKEMIQKNDFEMVYQPIFRLDDQSIFGYEALLRPGPTSPLSKPGPLMDLAEQLGIATEVDLACIEKALGHIPPMPRGSSSTLRQRRWRIRIHS